MKKVFTLTFLSLFALTIYAQDTKSGDIKNFRFGGTVLPSLFWYKPDNLKKFSANGTVAKFGVLINGEYSFSGNFALGFGIGLASSGGKMTYIDTASYYFNDGDIVAIKDTSTVIASNKFDKYKLNNRTYNASYFIIPLSLKMRTNAVGYMRYFFQPTLNVAIRKKVRANDDLISHKTGQQTQQNDLDITNDMGLLRLSTTISAGGEYYVTGSTALVFSIGYDYGLSNVVSGTSEYLIRNDKSAVKQKFNQNGVILTLGVLF